VRVAGSCFTDIPFTLASAVWDRARELIVSPNRLIARDERRGLLFHHRALEEIRFISANRRTRLVKVRSCSSAPTQLPGGEVQATRP
jgi:hypothetical protein